MSRGTPTQPTIRRSPRSTPGGQTYAWQARSVAGTETSQWSHTCYSTLDAVRPDAAPTITSANHPTGRRDQGGTPAHTAFPRRRTCGPTPPTITPAVASPRFDTATEFSFTPNATAEAASPIVGHSVSIGAGTPRMVKAGADGSATVKLKLDNVYGNNGLTVTSTSADGWVSGPAEVGYYFGTTPIVNSNDYPEHSTSGGVGVPGAFTFTAQVPHIVSYTYSFDLVRRRRHRDHGAGRQVG